MGVAEIKAAVVAILDGISDADQVMDYPGGALELEGGVVAPDFITLVLRNGVTETPRTIGRGGINTRIHNIEIHLHLPWDENNGAELEARFEARVDAISDALRPMPTLGGAATRCDPLVWIDDADGFRPLRGALNARFRKGVLRVTEDERRN